MAKRLRGQAAADPEMADRLLRVAMDDPIGRSMLRRALLAHAPPECMERLCNIPSAMHVGGGLDRWQRNLPAALADAVFDFLAGASRARVERVCQSWYGHAKRAGWHILCDASAAGDTEDYISSIPITYAMSHFRSP
jgi:hypothetical protein